ncbi:MAG: SDR family oxidoreductase [Rhodobacteraceae bacterium]|jgi:NAD(P)-dependent dehydrogenase (short-subunit alcohol dehydrogenase family)|nr:SDR family oxidoreductase [Paracoccaceae bacterium]
MDFDIKNKRVVVSAGGSGIGRAIVEGFIAQGAQVATCDINPDFVSDLKASFPKLFVRQVDVANKTAVSEFCDDAIRALGGLDCLVNNAGIAGPTLPIEDIPQDSWQACLDVCLNAQYYFIQSCIAALRASGDASIANLSSAAGKHGFAYRTPYAAAKWGVIGLTKSLAIELGDDKIRVNAILPGLVSGERQRNVLTAKAQRLGRSYQEIEAEAFSYTSIKDYVSPQDIADQIMYLASPAGRRISGQAIAVDGDTKMLA